MNQHYVVITFDGHIFDYGLMSDFMEVDQAKILEVVEAGGKIFTNAGGVAFKDANKA